MPAKKKTDQVVLFDIQDRVGYITLNRPDKRNALNGEVVAALKEAFAEAEASEDVKVVVLRANGDVFCAGADLEYLQKLQSNTYQENLDDSNNLMDLFLQIYQLRKVVIAQINGHAIAGGCGLATVCDLAYSVDSAKFGYTEVKIGFLPAIVMVFLIRKIGEGRAKQLLLTGDLINAEQAMNFGMINGVMPAAELEGYVTELAMRMCRENSGQSMQITKSLMVKVQDKKHKKALGYAAELNATARSNQDCVRGIEAFLSKEKIEW